MGLIKNKILLSLVCGVLIVGFAIGCGDKSTNIDDNKTNENNVNSYRFLINSCKSLILMCFCKFST